MTDGQRQLIIVCKVRQDMKKKYKKKIIIVLTFIGTCDNISLVLVRAILQSTMREWLSGGAPPCQGGGRGFDSRLALSFILSPVGFYRGFLFLRKHLLFQIQHIHFLTHIHS